MTTAFRITRYKDLRVGQTVTVELEGPGPGTRDPYFLRRVEGEIVGFTPYTLPEARNLPPLVNVKFEITEENADDWEALMPDQFNNGEVVPGYTSFTDYDIEPDWIVS